MINPLFLFSLLLRSLPFFKCQTSWTHPLLSFLLHFPSLCLFCCRFWDTYHQLHFPVSLYLICHLCSFVFSSRELFGCCSLCFFFFFLSSFLLLLFFYSILCLGFLLLGSSVVALRILFIVGKVFVSLHRLQVAFFFGLWCIYLHGSVGNQQARIGSSELKVGVCWL